MISTLKDTNEQTVCSVLLNMPRKQRFQTREITLDMASHMKLITRTCFPTAKWIVD
ncbi:MAG: transposase [Macellibacteroides fermentans]|uniref:transposase n=1 Tax=Macellibacteroides fermentans TaxID=879969 RepID=UPI000EDDA2F8|nr:hypothetical protein [Porphyromonadaceae bacterium]